MDNRSEDVLEASDTDVVIVVRQRSQVQRILSSWVHLIKSHNLIFVQEEVNEDEDHQDEEDDALLECAQDFSFKYFTKRNAQRFLATLPPVSPKKPRAVSIESLLLSPFKANACRSFGILASKARYVFTFDAETVVPAQDATTGETIDAAAQHIVNLRTPSTPYFFNTLYDPFQPGSAGFVRGYPFSLRLGVTTVISHGLTLGTPDYDAPTAIVKPQERNTRVVNAVITVPQNALFPMSATNLAFDRRRVGACMLLRSNVGNGGNSGLEDVWAGLCAKVTADHLGFGVKTGLPYTWRNGATETLAALRNDFRPLLLLEELIPFFQALRLPRSATTAEDCYFEIARTVRHKLKYLDSGFELVAASMEAWVDAWKAANTVP